MPKALTTKPRERFELPWDFSGWVDSAALLDGIVAEVDSLDWKNPALEEILRANPTFQPRYLLVLITYAYAIGVFESDEVALLPLRDKAVQARFSREEASFKVITRFRRDHRGLLKWTLSQCFKRVLRERFQLGDTPLPVGVRRALVEAASSRLDLARHVDRSSQAE
jgi:hypothetical protein